ncbi:MAG: Archaeal ATPase [Planctomycetes bacterium ADurb.Bin401]|nr:MAG: Archaeal ATPase [Planctomycetes bacterium ADurb.Bin401]
MIEELVEKANEELEQRPLVAIDHVLSAFRNNVNKQNSALLNLFFRAILKHLGGSFEDSSSNPIDNVFKKEFSEKQQLFVAVCLLRLLSVNDQAFKERGFRVKVFSLFDDVFSKKLYQILKIDIKQQTFEKENILKDLVTKIESDISTTISSFDNLEMLPNFRTRIMSSFNSISGKIIVGQFVPRELLELRLDEVFKGIEECLNATSPDIIQIFEKTERIIENYLLESDVCETYYCCHYLSVIANKCLKLLQKHFANSPFRKSADIVVEKYEKKYSLNIEGTKFSLRFIVNNKGPGFAFDVYFKIEDITDVIIEKKQIFLGNLEPGSLILEIPSSVDHATKNVMISGELSWSNFDKTKSKKEFIFEIDGQRADIDWDSLATEEIEPYSLQAVETKEELVGRNEILKQLIAQARSQNVGSSFIYGQKRVGKSSVVKTLKTSLMTLYPAEYSVVYFERGDFQHSEASATIGTLGRMVCEELQSDLRFGNIACPDFSSALAPLTEFIGTILRIAPNHKVILILDEFDELPIELYERGAVGDAFFGTLRSISGKLSFGVILVGSENMEHIMYFQGQALNKFNQIRLDYFDREKHWSDFQELVRKPVAKWFEVSDDAIISLYNQTAGNPFFTKLICGRLFKIMVERRDCHVTLAEVEEAIAYTLENDMGQNTVQHLWEDGIFEKGTNKEEIILTRRKVLLCLAEAYRQYKKSDRVTLQKLWKDNYRLDERVLEAQLKEFQNRQVLVEQNNHYDCKIPLFRDWLIEKGVSVLTASPGEDVLLALKKEEEKKRIQSGEIKDLAGKWNYRGVNIGADHIRAWLDQFGNHENQRLIFKILQKISFYSENNIRDKMKVAHGIVVRHFIERVEEKEKGKRKKSNILISYLDGIGKSGAYYAKIFADENEIYYQNIVERKEIKNVLSEKPDIQALVFIDDFVGTGNSACEYFKKLDQECGDTLKNTNLIIFFIVVSGFQESQMEIKGFLDKLSLPIKVHILDPLDESAKVFSDKSLIFTDQVDRHKALNICQQYGARLVKDAPLGYGDVQTTIVFADNCPNNSLPILWAESKEWKPLFKRQY